MPKRSQNRQKKVKCQKKVRNFEKKSERNQNRQKKVRNVRKKSEIS